MRKIFSNVLCFSEGSNFNTSKYFDKLISTEKCLSPNVSTTFSKFKMNENIFGAAVYDLIDIPQIRLMGQKLGNLVLIFISLFIILGFWYKFLSFRKITSTFMGYICKCTKKIWNHRNSFFY